ncbi:hypothetical protein BDU57DRAFT_518114 [Ampelomyces quisqualis]|uniref:Uncharacterized protein n=1 Tax=Ampelomyces quisqualis TaxID=50730 RepID=A0A6A5QKP5_AMPQU|nr:hypothetical protein BDU57DRAFT_518114 [Ampelomyces quisqualis]
MALVTNFSTEIPSAQSITHQLCPGSIYYTYIPFPLPHPHSPIALQTGLTHEHPSSHAHKPVNADA